MKNESNNQIVLSQSPEGPIAGYIVSFAKSLSEQGYTRRSIHRKALLAACFSRWLIQKGVALRGITPDHPLRYLRYRARQLRPYRGDAAALKHLLDFLRSKSAIASGRIFAAIDDSRGTLYTSIVPRAPGSRLKLGREAKKVVVSYVNSTLRHVGKYGCLFSGKSRGDKIACLLAVRPDRT